MYFKRFVVPRTLRNPYGKTTMRRNSTRSNTPSTEEGKAEFQPSVLLHTRPKKRWITRVGYSLIKLKLWMRRPSYFNRHANTSQATSLSRIDIDIRSFDPPVEPLNVPPPLLKKRIIPLPDLDDEEQEIEQRKGKQREYPEAGPSLQRPSALFDNFEYSDLDLYEPSQTSLPSTSSLVPLRHSPHNSTWEEARPEVKSVIGSLRTGRSSSCDSEETSDHGPSLSTQNDILDVVNRLPNELILKICEFLLFSELDRDLGNHHLLLGVRGLSRKWRALGEDVLWLSLRASSDLFNRKDLYAWYLEGSVKRRASRETISFAVVENIHTLDTKFLGLFSADLSRCQRADVKLLVDDLVFKKDRHSIPPLRVSNLRHFFWESNILGLCEYLPSRLNLPWSNLHSCLPWSSLVNLSLKCPLSLGDAYFVLAQGYNTLEVVSLGAINFTTHRHQDDQDTPISYNTSNSTITLHELKSLSIQSYIDLNDLFTNLIFPKLSSFNLRTLASTLHPSQHDQDDQLPGLIADLELPWEQLFSLSLECQDTHRLGDILSKCDSLQNLKWRGRCNDFSTGPPRILFGSPRLADNEETLAALSYPAQQSIVELDSLWGRLVNLSLQPDDMQPWPLGLILSRCDSLESFEWKGFRSNFTKPGPPKLLRLLKRLVVDHDEEATSSLLPLSTCLLEELTVPTFTSISLERSHLTGISSLIVKKGMTPTGVAEIKLPLQQMGVTCLDIQIIPGKMPSSQNILSSGQLRYLTLRLPSTNMNDLALLLEKVAIENIKQMDLLLPQNTFSTRTLTPILDKPAKTIKRINYRILDRSILPGMEWHTLHFTT